MNERVTLAASPPCNDHYGNRCGKRQDEFSIIRLPRDRLGTRCPCRANGVHMLGKISAAVCLFEVRVTAKSVEDPPCLSLWSFPAVTTPFAALADVLPKPSRVVVVGFPGHQNSGHDRGLGRSPNACVTSDKDVLRPHKSRGETSCARVVSEAYARRVLPNRTLR